MTRFGKNSIIFVIISKSQLIPVLSAAYQMIMEPDKYLIYLEHN
jgi:hypothetical protein